MSIVGLVMVVLMIPVKLSGKILVPFKARLVWMWGAHSMSFHGTTRGTLGPGSFKHAVSLQGNNPLLGGSSQLVSS